MAAVEITIRTAKIGRAYMAVTELAGITVRGRRADDEADAVRSLLFVLAGSDNDDAATAIDLAVQGDTIEGLITGLTELENADRD